MCRHFTAALLAAVILSPVTVHGGDRVVARVQHLPITHLEVLSLRSESPDMTYDGALQRLIERSLALVWAEENNIVVSDDELERVLASISERNGLSVQEFREVLVSRGESFEVFKDNLRDQLITSKAASEAVQRRVRLDDQDLDRGYRERYRSRIIFTLSHILFKVDDASSGGDQEVIKDRAVRVLEEIKAGKPFDEAAMEWSEDTSTASRGGVLGTFGEGELMRELEAAVIDSEAGEMVGPVLSPLGYHLIHLTDRSTVDPPPLDAVRDQLTRALLEEKRKEAIASWIDELRGMYFIEIFED